MLRCSRSKNWWWFRSWIFYYNSVFFNQWQNNLNSVFWTVRWHSTMLQVFQQENHKWSHFKRKNCLKWYRAMIKTPFKIGPCLMRSWEKPWVFREHAPHAPIFFQLCSQYMFFSHPTWYPNQESMCGVSSLWLHKRQDQEELAVQRTDQNAKKYGGNRLFWYNKILFCPKMHLNQEIC